MVIVVRLLYLVRFDSIPIPFLVLPAPSHGLDESETNLLSNRPAYLHPWTKRERERESSLKINKTFIQSITCYSFLHIYVVPVGLLFIHRRYCRGFFAVVFLPMLSRNLFVLFGI